MPQNLLHGGTVFVRLRGFAQDLSMPGAAPAELALFVLVDFKGELVVTFSHKLTGLFSQCIRPAFTAPLHCFQISLEWTPQSLASLMGSILFWPSISYSPQWHSTMAGSWHNSHWTFFLNNLLSHRFSRFNSHFINQFEPQVGPINGQSMRHSIKCESRTDT